MKAGPYFLILILSAFIACKKEPETYTVVEKPLNEAVYASGEIFPEEYEYLQTNSSERIMRILVKEGDPIKKGQVLVLLGTPSQNAQLRILTQELELAQQNASENSATLTEIREKIALARQQYEHDRLNAGRYQELAKDKAVSQKDADQATLDAESSLSEYKNLQQQLLARQKDLSGRVLNAANQLAQFRQVKEGRALASNLTGKIYSVNLEEGTLAKPGEPILMAGTENKFKLELLVDERDISKVKLGQKVLFETDAFAGRQFRGQVNKLVPVLQKENRSFKVEVQVRDTVNFFPQSSVEANIMVREHKNALVIPTDYLTTGDSVLVKTDKETRKITITTGARDGAWAEVISGLKKGVRIVKP